MTQPAFAQIAPINRRAIGYLIDAAIAAGIAVVLYGALIAAISLSGGVEAGLTTLLIGGPIVSLLLLGWFVVYTLMQAGKGSIGMRAQGLRLVSAVDGSPLGFGRALLRNVIFGLAAGIVVGYFTPLFDGSGRFQGWHDKVANALVLDARQSPAPVSAPSGPDVTVAAGAAYGSAGGAPVPPAIPGLPAAPASGGFTPPTVPAPPAPEPSPVSAPAASAFTVPADAPPVAPATAAPAPAAAYDPAATPPRPPAPFESPAPSGSPAPVENPSADEGSLIAFVPGVTQPGPPSRVEPPAAAQEPESDLDPGLDETIVQRPSTPPAPATPPASATPPVAATPPVPVTPPVPAMPPAPEVPTAQPATPEPFPATPAPALAPTTTPAFDAEYDEEAELEQTRISVPGHRLIFTWDDGTRVPVSRRTIFGRNPAPEDGAVLVPVRDETLSLSKTHFEAASEASGGWVLDRHSTNGMTIVRDGQRFACPAGQRVPVRLGDAIEIGDRIVTVGGYA
ncbi:MAG: RDD family protein [Microbacterium sp.]